MARRAVYADQTTEHYGVATAELTQLLQDRDLKDLVQLGGGEGLAKRLHTDIEYGLDDAEEDMHRRCFPQLHSHEGDDGLGPSTSESSRRWRRAALVLNATRRFRRFPLQRRARTRFRVCAHTICAVNRFKRGLKLRKHSIAPAPEGYGVATDALTQLLQDRDLKDLERLGGVEGLAMQLHTDMEYGLDETEEEMHRRREAYGANTYPKKVAKRFWSFIWDACKDTTLNILMACAVVSLATGIWTEGIKEGWYEGTSIGVAVLLVIVVTAASDYKQSLNFQNLNAEKENMKLEVLRAGRRQTVSIFDLVVGDIVPLSIGGQVPADGVLVEGHSLSIDESTMTGESLPAKKDKSRPFLLSGCKVQDGQGTMLVTGVGLNTEWGQVMASISHDNGELTPLQVRLNSVATLVGKVGLMVASVVLVILIIRYFAITYKNATGRERRVAMVIKDMVHVFTIAVTIVVVAVPKGLPLAVTLTLAYSMRTMMADKSLVRMLGACETMGSATTICSDKTGTLTTNKMTVIRACVAGEIKDESSLGLESLPANLKTTVVQSICLNSNGNVSPHKDGEEPAVTGSPTEAALLTWGVKLGMHFRGVRHENQILHVETFNSEKKRAGVIFKTGDGEAQLHWKGAAEIVLDLCSHWIDSNGSPQPMTEEKREEFSGVIEGMAAQALRCIAFAYRPFDESELPKTEEARSDWKAPDQSLILMAIAGIKDPCRPGVREAVQKCQRAGVKVRMVTGDNIYTAKAIAAECGILTEGGLVVEGREFCNWDEAKLNSRALDELVVMARSSLTEKLKLVKALKERRGDVVAVTGDGTNEAPALKEADIGLSMGIAGTEVAKESSDIIILDDNFTSVVKVVRWGRSVYANIQKFIQFQLTVNVVALTINFVAAVSSGEVPLTVVQLLWVNLIMDTMGALALATEAPTDDLMVRNPIGRTEPLITNIMWRNIFGQAFYQITVLLILTYRGIEILSLKGTHEEMVLERNTIIFNAFVFCQIFNEVNARRPEKFNVFEGIHRNYLFLGIIGVTIVFQAIIVTFLNDFADTTMLHIKWWGLCVAIGSVALPLAVLIKCVPVPKKPILKLCGLRRIRRSIGRRRGTQTEHVSGDVEVGYISGSSRSGTGKTAADEILELTRQGLRVSQEEVGLARRSVRFSGCALIISCFGIVVAVAIFFLQHFIGRRRS